MDSEDVSTLFAVMAILLCYMLYKTGLWLAMIEDRAAITVVLTGTMLVLWFFRRHSQ